MNIAIIHTRLYCLDGVSLEAEKWSHIYKGLGHNIFLIAGKLGKKKKNSLEIPIADYLNPEIKNLHKQLFQKELPQQKREELIDELYCHVGIIKRKVKEFIIKNKINFLSVENIFSLPFNIPLTIAIADIMNELNLPCIARHHDFYWERKYIFKTTKNVRAILENYFPPKRENMLHVTINKQGQSTLKKFKNIQAKLIYNHFDVHAMQEEDNFNVNLRKDLTIGKDNIIFLQPTRIVDRKQIELSIRLVAAMQRHLKKCTLLITGPPYEDETYNKTLKELAKKLKVRMIYGYKKVQIERKRDKKKRIYSMSDAYTKSDIVTLPSSIEGFGNPVIEASLNRKPLFVNRYPVMNELLRFGFDFILINDKITKETIDKTYKILTDRKARKDMLEHNFIIAREYFSLKHLRLILNKMIHQLL